MKNKTKPPQPYTEASLLTAMENAGRFVDDEELKEQLKESGLGTPATRAAIIERLISRENSRARTGGTRFEVGNIRKLKEIKNKMRVYPTKVEIAIVQPGIDETLLTEDMVRIISGSASYLLDTYGIELQVICS